MKSHCAVPWHRALLARMPRGLYRRVQGFEAAIEDGVSEFGRSLPRGARVLDSGAGESQYAHAFGHCRYVGVDLGVGDEDWDYSQINVRADLRRLPFRDDSFAAAVNIVVLEHVVEPQTVLAEISRVLQTGAPLFLVVPQEWGVHQEPHDYFRYTRFGLESLLKRAGLGKFRIEAMGGFFTLLGRRLLDSVFYFRGGWRWLLFPLVAAVVGPAGLLVPFLDFLDSDTIGQRKSCHSHTPPEPL